MEELEGNIFCEICGAADADAELKLCPNCLGEFQGSSEDDEEFEDESS